METVHCKCLTTSCKNNAKVYTDYLWKKILLVNKKKYCWILKQIDEKVEFIILFNEICRKSVVVPKKKQEKQI